MSTPSDQRPDILMIMPDQMRGDCLSMENHPVLQTPNIDTIGAQGMHFTRAYSTCPSCIPARRAMLTARYPATNGMVGYRMHEEFTQPTFPGQLGSAGYHTTLVGRGMHQHPEDRPYGYQDRTASFPDFDSGSYAEALEHKFPGEGGVAGHGISANGWSARSWQFPDTWHPTTWGANRAGEKMKEAPVKYPHFITASFVAPHPPFIPPACYYERYLQSDLPPRAIGDWAVLPANDLLCPVDCNRINLQGDALRQAQAGYFGLIAHLDDQVHRMVFDFKRQCRQRGRPWVILFMADHGEMLGDHYLFRKCEPYDASARVPFLIQGSPEMGFVEGGRYDQPVCLEDIGPTLIELAGGEPMENVDGPSLVPILRGESQPVREVLHGEHSPCYDDEQAFHLLTDGRMKYIWRPHSGDEQLFDLTNDPQECTNFAAQAEHSAEVTHWRDRLIAQLKDRPEGFSDGEKLIAGRPYPDLMPT